MAETAATIPAIIPTVAKPSETASAAVILATALAEDKPSKDAIFGIAAINPFPNEKIPVTIFPTNIPPIAPTIGYKTRALSNKLAKPETKSPKGPAAKLTIISCNFNIVALNLSCIVCLSRAAVASSSVI